MKILLQIILICIVVANARAQQPVQFSDFFKNKSMRIDFYHTGTSTEEHITLDHVYVYGQWAGAQKTLIQKLDLGRYIASLVDKKSGTLIFSKHFDSYFGEYKASESAGQGIWRTYHESVLTPLPKDTVLFSLERNVEARAHAEKAKSQAQDDAESVLILGATYLESSTDMAVGMIKKALEANAELNVAYRFLGGQIRHARSLCSLVAPTVNSYKRLVPGFEAPVYICWGRVNRSALLRIPMVTPSKAKEGARVELRCPDPTSNPYLALAVMLAAGLDGIEKKIAPPKAVEENVYGFSDEKLEEMKIATLPQTIGEAVDELETNDVLCETLGKALTDHFIQAKRQEWHEFLMQVTPWEIDRYL